MGRKNRKQRRASSSQKSGFAPYNIYGGDVLPYLHAVPTNYDLEYGDGGRIAAFKYIGTINRAVSLIADAAHSMPWQIVRGKGKKKEVIVTSEDRNPSHPMAKAIQDVFRRQGQPLFSLMSYSTLINGETYLEKIIDGLGFSRVKWLNPYATEPLIIGGTITGYRYAPINGGLYATLSAEDVAYYHTFGGDDDLRGHSKVDAAMREINLDRSVYSYVKNTLWNNARPGLILAPASDTNSGLSGMFTPQETAALERQASDFHRGTQNAHNTLVSPRPLNATILESPDIDRYYSILDPNTRKIATVFGTPLAMLGDSNASTYKDGKDVRDSFYINAVIPHCRMIGDFINIAVMPDYAETPEDTFEFDTSEFEDTSDVAKVDVEVNNNRLSGGYITLADAARAQGLDPAPELEGLVMIEGTPVPLSEVGNLWRVKFAAPTPTFPSLDAPMPDTSRLEISAPKTPQLPARAEYLGKNASRVVKVSKASETDYCILAPLPDNASVKMIQDVLRGLIPSVNIMEWQDPKTFHLTLTYATGTQEQIDTVYLDGLLQTLIVDRVDQFDTPEGWAVHLVVRSTQDIVAYQSRLVRDMRAAGMELSTYSDVWQPHITLCYTSEPIEPFAITPIVLTLNSVDVSDDDYQVVASGGLKTHAHKPYVFEKPLSPDVWREKALNELKAWQKHQKAGKTRAFEPVYTRDILHDFQSTDASNPTVRTAEDFFDYAFDAVRYQPFKATQDRIDRVFDPITRKDIGETRQEFEDEFLLAIADTKDGNLSKAQLRSLLHTVIRTLGEQAYRDGLEDGGVKDAELTDEDQLEIARLRRTAEGYANDFVKEFDGYSEAQLDQRPKMWTLKTLNDFYLSGLASADANGIYVWRLGKTEEHCATCLQMNGQRMRLKTWIKNGILPQSDKLDCKGYNCDCGIFNIRGGARG